MMTMGLCRKSIERLVGYDTNETCIIKTTNKYWSGVYWVYKPQYIEPWPLAKCQPAGAVKSAPTP